MVCPEPQSSSMEQCSSPAGTRRRFFQWVTGAAAGVIGLSLAVPLVGYVISPALKRRARSWVDVAGMDELPVGRPKQLEYMATIRDGCFNVHSAAYYARPKHLLESGGD